MPPRVETAKIVPRRALLTILPSVLHRMIADFDTDLEKQKKAENRYNKIGLLEIGQIVTKS